jgi:hypothetical protein
MTPTKPVTVAGVPSSSPFAGEGGFDCFAGLDVPARQEVPSRGPLPRGEQSPVADDDRTSDDLGGYGGHRHPEIVADQDR